MTVPIASLIQPLMILLVVMGALVAAYWFVMRGYGAPRFAAKVLSAREQHIVAALADASFPAGGEPALSGTEAGLVEYLDAHLAVLASDKRFLIRLLISFLEWEGVVLGPHRRRFTKQSAEQQTASLWALQTSNVYFLRVTLISIRTLMCLGYMANPQVESRVGATARLDPFGLTLTDQVPS